MYGAFIETLQRLGRALMLPIAILPIAGLLLRLGDKDMLNILLIHDAGNAIFANLALIFAIGISVGFARDNNGTAGLAGAVGYLVMMSTLNAIDPGINMGVLSGIISGLVAGALYNRFKDIALPQYLAFFGGRRFVPIATGLAALSLGVLFGLVWPPVQHVIDDLGNLLVGSGSLGAFAFGVLNRLLIVTGLHHILNNLMWFVFGAFTDPETGRQITGDLARYFAGDPKGGQFMAGMFPVMMFGLPAACLAMYRNARPERRKLVGGLLLSMALTAFLTGVTEPIEFAFMFLAPLLYLLHALLTGLSMAITDLLNIRLGFTFSGGAIDLALGWGKSTNGWMLWPLGLFYAAAYYFVFDFCIRRFQLKTPGREEIDENTDGETVSSPSEQRAPAFIKALGGATNLEVVDACTTRLRLKLTDRNKASDAQLKALGAMAVVRPGKAGSLQVVVGPEADSIADEIRRALPAGVLQESAAQPTSEDSEQPPVEPVSQQEAGEWLQALGGQDNLRSLETVALTRLRVVVSSGEQLQRSRLAELGCQGVSQVAEGVYHLLVGARAEALGQSLGSLDG
ncbi:N-acetylglucosamine-specific PTS transporter subunit IIBC [Pseudomonas denitrificans (nom. rej.)]|nr:N-acetylglucosamine-specific PTS transporter subunit IIBC [Pseudomonas denitrificans (nom. rej.)]